MTLPARVHQFVPTLEPGAIGAHALEVRAALRAAGVESELFAEHFRAGWDAHGHDFRDYGGGYAARADDLLLYHSAIGSVVADFVIDRPEPKAVDYHNITPPSFFVGWEPDVVRGLAWGRQQLADLGWACRFGLGDSAYNCAELDAVGFRATAVVPIILDPSGFDRDVDAAARARLEADKQAGGCDYLFVGRVAPHKAQHDLVKMLAVLRRHLDPRARLRIVGGSSSDAYVDALRAFAAELGVADGLDLAGSVSDGELAAYYRTADVLVSASEHEGFCVPLLEAMHHGVPIVAFAAAAVPETLAAAGVLLDDKAPDRLAVAAHQVATDRTLHDALAAAGHARLAELSPDAARGALLTAIAELTG